MLFQSNKPKVLSTSELETLLVTGTCLNIGAKLRKHGAQPGELCAVIMVAVEACKIKSSNWNVEGNLGTVLFGSLRVGGYRNLDVELNLTDLTKFTFPGNPDYSNLSLLPRQMKI